MSGEFGKPAIMSHDDIDMSFEQFMAGHTGGKHQRMWQWPSPFRVDIHQSPEGVADMFDNKPTIKQGLGARVREVAAYLRSTVGMQRLQRTSQ